MPKFKVHELTGLTVYKDGTIIGVKGKPLKPYLNRNGYHRIKTRYLVGREMKLKNFYVHHLVWYTFKGTPAAGMHIDHKDRDVSNNKLRNLRVITAEKNRARRKYGKK